MPACAPTTRPPPHRISNRLTRTWRRKWCSTPSTPVGSPARGRCSRSTATRTACSRWGSTGPSASWSPSSTGPAAGAMRRSSKNTPSSRNSPPPRSRWWRPCAIADSSLHAHGGYRFALYPRRGGRAPNLDDTTVLEWIGRFLGRIHALGAQRPFAVRPPLDADSFAIEPRRYLLEHDWLPRELKTVYAGVAQQAIDAIAHCQARAGAVRAIRLHGDTHEGNILWTEGDIGSGRPGGPHFVDFDDARTGPAVQDLWMLLGDREQRPVRLKALLEGLRRLRRVRRPRTAPGRGAAHAAPVALQRLDCPALERPGVSRRVSLVRHPTLLGRPHPRAARADRGDERSADRRVALPRHPGPRLAHFRITPCPGAPLSALGRGPSRGGARLGRRAGARRLNARFTSFKRRPNDLKRPSAGRCVHRQHDAPIHPTTPRDPR